jgi:ABC-type multidrug transport system fused ATPase/permease subunit
MKSLLSIFSLIRPYLSIWDKSGLLAFSILLFLFSLLDLTATLLFSVGIYNMSGGKSPLELLVFGKNITSVLSESQFVVDNLFLLAGFLIILKNIMNLIVTRNLFLYLAKVQQSLTLKVTRLITKQGYETIKKVNFQESANAMTAGMNSIIVGIIGQGISFLCECFLLVLLTITLLSIDLVTFGVIFLYFVICSLIIVRLTSKRVVSLGNEMVTSDVKSREVITDTLLLWRELKITNLLNIHLKNFLEHSKNLSNSFARSNWLQSLPKYFMEILSLTSVISFWCVTKINHSSTESAALLLVFVAFSSRLVPSLLRLQNSFIAMRNCQGNALYALNFLETLNNKLPSKNSFTESTLDRKMSIIGAGPLLRMKNVSFCYTDSDVNALTNIDFELYVGEKVALFGVSGSGKSTFCDLVCGFLSPSTGIIQRANKSNGEEIEIAFLPQEVTLMSGTIADNVTLERTTSINTKFPREILAALSSAELGDFVKTLPQGLATLVGNSNSGLSGGQKQRIGIARSIYRNSDLIVMDEPGSSLDGETEELILTTLKNLGKLQSLIYISHRPASLKYFDKIIFFNDGLIEDFGHFAELYRKNLRFREIIDASRIDLDFLGAD